MTKDFIKASELGLKEKVGQLFMPAAFINDGEEEIAKLELLIKEYAIGGICFFHSRASAATNYEGKKEVLYNKDSLSLLKSRIARFQKISKIPLLISIDAEWGLAMRVENTPQYPYAITLGAIDKEEELIFELGKRIGMDCREAGIHWNFSPVADVNSNPNNPVISYRSFGSNKKNVSQKAIAMCKGLNAGGVINSAKHFPGHGDTATDSHLGLPFITKPYKELWEEELYPFRQLIENGLDSVMVGHLSVPSLSNSSTEPSSLSKSIIKELLRKQLNFKGVVVSDALNMHAVSKLYPQKGELEWLAFDAGNDILCFAENVPEGINTILKNAEESQIEDSFTRVWNLKKKAFSMKPQKTGATQADFTDLNRELAEKSITCLGNVEALLESYRNSNTVGLIAGKIDKSAFFDICRQETGMAVYHLFDKTASASIEKLKGTEKMLLGVFPPSVKPHNNFGFLPEEIEKINRIISTNDVVLYLFGNPYFNNVLSPSAMKNTVIVYQDFEVFQQVAANHFLGTIKSYGTIPVTLD